MKVRPVLAQLFHADTPTDGQTVMTELCALPKISLVTTSRPPVSLSAENVTTNVKPLNIFPMIFATVQFY